MLLPKLKVLFLCTGNSCRSQMAEGWARELRGAEVEPFSAGTAPSVLDRLAVRVMADAGVEIAGHWSKSTSDLSGIEFDHVVTVCDGARQSCPVFPGAARVTHAGFDDPPALARGAESEEQALACYRRVSDEIRDFVATFGFGRGDDEPGRLDGGPREGRA